MCARVGGTPTEGTRWHELGCEFTQWVCPRGGRRARKLDDILLRKLCNHANDDDRAALSQSSNQPQPIQTQHRFEPQLYMRL